MTDDQPLDLRLPILGIVGWIAAAASGLTSLMGQIGVALSLPIAVWLRGRLWQGQRAHRTAMAAAALWVAVVGSVALRDAIVTESWVVAVARQHASAHLVVTIRGDPRITPGATDDRATIRATVSLIEARGKRSTTTVPVLLVTSSPKVHDLRYGEQVSLEARLQPSTYPDTGAVAIISGAITRVRDPRWIDRSAQRVRDSIQAMTHEQTDAAGMVPALVDGDERALPPGLEDDFRTTGLTHLLAVSGANFAMLGAAWLGLARAIGIRGRALLPIGMFGIIALVLLARAEPSVIRAAVMGAVGLLGMGRGGRQAGARALGACLCGVMLFDPQLALSAGFALSVLATAGILWLAPGWRDALHRWLPLILAEMLAVALAAYLACLPLVVALSGRVSLVAIPANLLAGVAVGPATVLGFLGGVIGLVVPTLGRVIAAPATWCSSWIAVVAKVGSRLPHADTGLPGGPMSIVLVGLICSGVIAVMAGVLRRPVVAIPATAVLLVTPLLALPGGSWPPSGWVLVVCDVGQGDGLVLRLGNGRAMVIDTGPDPGAMRQCIRDLEITRVPLLVLTHFHADHVNGLSGVLSAAQVDSIAVTSLADPPGRVTSVRALATQARVPIRIARVGEQGREGDVRWLVLAPVEPPPADSDSPPNDASIVLLVEVRGVRILLLGDEETGSQEILARRYPGLRADVVKVAHHGSAKQDPDLLKSLGAREALISAGRGNSYGLPKASTLLLLQQAGMGIHRTDTDGAQSVVVEDSGRVRVVARN